MGRVNCAVDTSWNTPWTKWLLRFPRYLHTLFEHVEHSGHLRNTGSKACGAQGATDAPRPPLQAIRPFPFSSTLTNTKTWMGYVLRLLLTFFFFFLSFKLTRSHFFFFSAFFPLRLFHNSPRKFKSSSSFCWRRKFDNRGGNFLLILGPRWRG